MIRAIGPYELVRRLGRGGMAEVHLALAHGASGFERHVAIKMLAPELTGEPELERALIREATLAGTLHHATWSRCSASVSTTAATTS
jgi:serine/threonine-protein kinase